MPRLLLFTLWVAPWCLPAFLHAQFNERWGPVTAAELEQSASTIDPDAGAEYLAFDLRVNQRDLGEVRRSDYYQRIKIYNDKAAEAKAWFRRVFDGESDEIDNFRARVTQPDGTFREIGQEALYVETASKSEYRDRREAKAVLPEVRAGCVIEIEWTQRQSGYGLYGFRYPLRNDLPTRQYRLEILPNRVYASVIRGYNFDLKFSRSESDGYLVEAENLIASNEEPHRPPRWDFEPWVYVLFEYDIDLLKVENYWNAESGKVNKESKDSLRPKQGAVKELAARLFAGVEDPEEKLFLAYRYCTDEIVNVNTPRAQLTLQERKALKNVDTPAQTIKRGYGKGRDVNNLFASLAILAGYEAVIAYCEDKDLMKFNAGFVTRRWVLPERVVALRRSKKDPWRYFDPGYDYLPFGYIDADCTNAIALLGDGSKADFKVTPPVESSFSVLTRRGDLSLDEQGTLRGKIVVSHGGHLGVELKRRYDDWSSEGIEEDYLERFALALPSGSISDFKVEHLFTRAQPLTVSFTVEVPRYAEVLGNRMVLPRDPFLSRSQPVFTARERETDIVFRFPWEERNVVYLELPDGFGWNADSVQEADSIQMDELLYRTNVDASKSGRTLRLTRDFRCRVSGFKVDAYPDVVELFERINREDTQSLVLVKE